MSLARVIKGRNVSIEIEWFKEQYSVNIVVWLRL